MIDSFAPLVVALTHAGFPMARPVQRPLWGPILSKPPASVAELQARIEMSQDPAIAQCLSYLAEVEREIERLGESGVWAASLFHESYPARWHAKIAGKQSAILFGVGNPNRLNRPSVAIVGSRAASAEATSFAAAMAAATVEREMAVVSGGARGIDLAAIVAAIRAGGEAMVVAADSLAEVNRRLVRSACDPDAFTIVTANHPETGFTVGLAMGRNKLIYAAAEVAVVVSSEEDSGGTWAGAVEALKHGWTPVAVWMGPGAGAGNEALAKRGAIPIRTPEEAFDRPPQSGATQSSLGL